MLKRFLRSRRMDRFQARSADRDAQSDRRMRSAVAKSIDDALTVLRLEKEGLSKRFNEAYRSAVQCNGDLACEPEQLAQVQVSEEYIRAARRIKQLTEQIADLRFVRTAFHFRLGGLTTTGDAVEVARADPAG